MVGVGPPVGTQQKLKGADFGNGRQAVCKQVDANQRHGQDGDAGGDQKDHLHHFFAELSAPVFFCFSIHKLFTALLQKKGCKVTALSCVLRLTEI